VLALWAIWIPVSLLLGRALVLLPLPGWLASSVAIGVGFWQAITVLGMFTQTLTGELDWHDSSDKGDLHFWFVLEAIRFGCAGSAVGLHFLLGRLRLAPAVEQVAVGGGVFCCALLGFWVWITWMERALARDGIRWQP
jgi:hypothetical protein